MRRLKYVSVLLIGILCSVGVLGAAFAAEYEQFKDRKASDILESKKLKGDHFRVRPVVRTSGYMNHFTVDSDYGTFEVTGNGSLRKLEREISAMTALKKIEKTKAFGKALAASAMKPIDFAGHLITDPVDTVTGVPKGVGKLFSNAYTSITTKKQAGEDSATESMLSLSKFKREYAYYLGVDPYSSNVVFQNELNRVAWAAAVGNLSFAAATAPIGGGLGTAISFTGFAQSMREYLKDQPPSQIRSDAEEQLSSMGVSKEDIKKFLENSVFSPRHTAVIVASLMKLNNVKGRSVYIKYASAASDGEQADFMMHMAEMMRGVHEKVSPLKEIMMNTGLVTASTTKNAILIPFPLDYGIWTERADKILTNMVSALSAGNGKYEFWVTGTFSPLARKNIEALGIKVVERADKTIDFVD